MVHHSPEGLRLIDVDAIRGAQERGRLLFVFTVAHVGSVSRQAASRFRCKSRPPYSLTGG
jgi:hypothetical protein